MKLALVCVHCEQAGWTKLDTGWVCDSCGEPWLTKLVGIE